MHSMPTTWKDASFHDIRAEGAFLVSAVRQGGKTRFLRVKSLAGEPCIIKSDLPEDMRLVGPKATRIRQSGGQVELDLKEGEDAVLYTGDKPDYFVVSALPMNGDEMNGWGIRKQ
jgi:alpha-L-fucosidase 2